MAETLTFEQNTEVTSVDNLSAEEQDSLQVGEAMQEAQDNLLAGKYKDAKELETAYVELQKKLGESNPEPEEDTQDPPETEAKEEKEEKKEEDTGPDLLDTIWEEAQGEKYTEETLEKLKNINPAELVNMHLKYRQNNSPKELSEQDVKELKGIVGGDESYSNMLTWAQQNLNETEVNMFDKVMERGDPLAAFFAVRSLAYRYNDAIGFDGDQVQGKAPKANLDRFESQQEMVAAMSDKRYDNDPAYRRKIMEKLERSDINF
tara:strand:+ start:327 stop:1112 length:786 start_codon:yes stop_codon:yes gene_type:complete